MAHSKHKSSQNFSIDSVVFCFNENDLVRNTALEVYQTLKSNGHNVGLADWSRKVRVRGPFLKIKKNKSYEQYYEVYTPKIPKIDRSKLKGLSKFNSNPCMENLLGIVYNKNNAGGAVANYLVRYLADSQPRVEKLRKQSIWMLLGYAEVFELTVSLIRNLEINRIAVYQGNWLNDRAVLDAANFMKIKTLIYGEVDNSKYWLSLTDLYKLSNWYSLPFPRFCRANKYVSHNESGYAKAIQQIKRRLDPIENTFVSKFEQVKSNKYLPNPNDVVFFTSNPNVERFGLSEEWNGNLGTQEDVIRLISKLCTELGKKLFIRIHPNLRNQSRRERRSFIKILNELENAIIIPPESKVNSYKLASSETRNFIYISNIGFELAAQGIPVASLAKSTFSPSNAVPLISDVKTLVSYMKFGFTELQIKNHQRNALLWSMFLEEEFYIKFRFNINSKNINITTKSFLRFSQLVQKLIHDKIWFRFLFYKLIHNKT